MTEWDDIDYRDEPPLPSREEVNIWDVPDAQAVGDLLQSFVNYLDVDDRQKALRMLPYSSYLLTDHWRMTRRAALQATGYHCERCGKGRGDRVRLNVHHKSYERLGNELPEDLEVLCRSCHEKEHGLS